MGPGGLTVDDCIIRSLGYGIRNYGNRLTVINCELYDLKYSGVHASGNDGNTPVSVLIKNNWIHNWHEANNSGAGIMVQYDNRIGEVSYNYISGMRMGIAYYYGGPRPGLGQMLISHNTVDLDYDPSNPTTVTTTMGVSLWGTGDNAGDVIIRDNIFANAKWFGVYQEGATISGSVTVQNNLFFNNYWLYWPDYQYTYQWFGNDARAQAGWGPEGPAGGFTFAGNISAQDPLFGLDSEVGREQWRLMSGSPGLAAATDGTDIGAWQAELPVLDSLELALGAEYTSVTTISVGHTESGDPATTIDLCEDPGFASCQSVDVPGDITYAFVTSTNELKTVWARLRNAAGNSNMLSGTVTLDTVAPFVTGVTVQSEWTVDVAFSETTMGPGAESPGSYTLSGSGQGTLPAKPDSVLALGGGVYRLTWSSGDMVFGGDITIAVDPAVADLAWNPIVVPLSGTHAGGAVPVGVSAFGVE